MSDVPALRWEDAGWRERALDWVHAELAGLGRRVVGPVEQPHVRPWSTAMRVPTDSGVVWFKADGEGPAYEVRLLAALTRFGVPHVLEPLAVDVERAWMLLPDGGTTLRQVLADDRDLRHWERALVAYAELQRASAEHGGALLALGVPDARPEVLPGQLAALLDDDVAMRRGRPGGLAPEQDAAIRELLPAYGRWCTDLAAVGLPPAVDHGDLHDANVFVGGGRTVVYDWGDAAVSDPLASLLVALRSIGHRFELRAGDPALRRVRAGYLEVWSGEGRTVADLERAVELSVRVAVPARALSWQRALRGVPEERVSEDWVASVPEWLLELLEPPVT